jgi:hypothetical protein
MEIRIECPLKALLIFTPVINSPKRKEEEESEEKEEEKKNKKNEAGGKGRFQLLCKHSTSHASVNLEVIALMRICSNSGDIVANLLRDVSCRNGR